MDYSPYLVSLIALGGVILTNVFTEKARREDRRIEEKRRADDAARELNEMKTARILENRARERKVISDLILSLWESKEKVQAVSAEKSKAIYRESGVASIETVFHFDQLNALAVSDFYREAELLVELAELEITNSEVSHALANLKLVLCVESYNVIHDGDRRLSFPEWMKAATTLTPYSAEVENAIENVRAVALHALSWSVTISGKEDCDANDRGFDNVSTGVVDTDAPYPV